MSGFLRCFRKEGTVVSNSKDTNKILTGDHEDNNDSYCKHYSRSEYSWYPPISQGKLIDSVRNSIPNLSSDLRKGNLGRIGIIGGSKEYTGAPYFAGISSLKIGADLCHIFCTPEAATPIKTYSPELIVHPLLPSSNEIDKNDACNKSIDSIKHWIMKMDVTVIGCGLGREKEILLVTTELIKICRSFSIPIIIDADGLFVIAQQPNLIKGYKHCILTPNLLEFHRLEKSIENMLKHVGDDHLSMYGNDQSDLNIELNRTQYSHIEVLNCVSKVSPNSDSSINVPIVLPLVSSEENLPDSLSPCERIPNIEWPSTNDNAVLQLYDNGEEINLFHKANSSSMQEIEPKITRSNTANPLNICFYEHILNENCIGTSKSDEMYNSETMDSNLMSEEEFLRNINRVFKLSKSLGNVCIVLKDKIDIITNGEAVAVCNITGSHKRSAGQGDILSGVASTLFNWSIKYISHGKDQQIFKYPDIISAYGSCLIVRLSAYIAFKKKLRSMLASDLIENLPYVFESIFEVNKHEFTEDADLLLLFNESPSPK
ncbi:putative YjeF-like nucleotide binding protein [Cryptosporidium canis]|uniref:ATP-dependent (S)-NAD(P)H-hydrate dehydratase n=1 Tax=Cryptosporidium canis TaxID=195482 RepID=A0A9D5HYA0_9CRYT|nr:putative YjeF-like nucleotide binding protein [Cryptosporidium canis]